MFEKLIEKIKALDMGEREFHPYEKWTWIDAIDAVVEAINASEPPELDAPDSDGWWWLKYGTEDIDAKRVVLIGSELLVDEGMDRGNYDLRHYHGKWIKAITPKEAK